MDKIFEILGIEKLDESKQESLKDTLKTIIEVKAQEIADAKVEEVLESKKTSLKEEFDTKFAEHRDSITSKFSNFVDTVLDEEMKIPATVLKYAKQGELYHELIEQFKTRLSIDEGMISGEIRDMLKEAKSEIESLREKLDESTGKNLELGQDASEMAAQLYVREKCDGLTEAQKKYVTNLIGDELVKENIDKKFTLIVETMGIINEEEDEDDKKKGDEGDEGDDKTYEMTCESCGNKETLKEKKSEYKCPECGETMKPSKVEEGHVEVKDDKKTVVKEDKSPWETYKGIWLNGMRGSSEE